MIVVGTVTVILGHIYNSRRYSDSDLAGLTSIIVVGTVTVI